MKKIYPNKEVCIGCHLCEVACLTAHSKTKDTILAHTVEKAQEGLMPRRNVAQEGPVCVALACRHCEEPMCGAACISGALTKNTETGRCEYNEEQCVGCWSCLMACPFGSIRRHPVKEKIIKCDLCAGRDMPACVEACPNAGLVFEDRGKD